MYQYYVICKLIKAEIIYYAVVQNIPSHYNYYYYVIVCPFTELLPCKVDLYSLINTMLYTVVIMCKEGIVALWHFTLHPCMYIGL